MGEKGPRWWEKALDEPVILVPDAGKTAPDKCGRNRTEMFWDSSLKPSRILVHKEAASRTQF